MRAGLLLVFSLFLSIASFAQGNYIIAGQRESMIFTNYDISTGPYFNICQGIGDQESFSMPIDLNQDGIQDCSVMFYCYSVSAGGGTDIAFNIVTDSNCLVLCSTDSETKVIDTLFGNACYPYVYGFTSWYARGFSQGDTLTDGASGQWLTGTFTAEATNSGCSFIAGDGVSGRSSYFFVKLIESPDTLLGYICVENLSSSSATRILNNYACQGQQSTYTISDINNVKACNSYSIYPVPFSNHLNITGPELFRYKIYASQGSLILEGNTSPVNTEMLAPGIYVIQVANEFGASYRRIAKL